MTDIDINEDRLWRSIEELGTIGEQDDGGMFRVTGSEADRRARDRLVNWFEDAGLTVEIDPVGNVIGRREGRSDLDPIVTGSHVDTVPNGGKFDGVAGVLTALEVVRAWNDADYVSERPLELVVFTEEEGTRFNVGLLGSLFATGKVSLEEALSLTDEEGRTLEETLEQIDYRGEGSLMLDDAAAFIELHIEQGPILDGKDVPIGIVDTIAGITHHRTVFSGEADHAGNTPMDQRYDAFMGTADFAQRFESKIKKSAATSATVGTIGKCAVKPNGTNVVPGEVSLGIDIRDTDGDVLTDIVEAAERFAENVADERELSVSWDTVLEVPPTEMTPSVITRLENACKNAEVPYLEMTSGAGHDAMNVADVAPTGMIFVPSVDGISHSPEEFTRSQDLTKGTVVLERALRQLTNSVEPIENHRKSGD